jgi:hypothetical protein
MARHMGFDLNLPNLDQALNILTSQGTTGLEQAVANAIVTNPDVQAASKTFAEETAAQKLAKYFIANKKTIMIGGLALGVLAAGYMFSKRK